MWLFTLLIFISNSPIRHRFIGDIEKDYIITHIPQTTEKLKVKVQQFKFQFRSCVLAQTIEIKEINSQPMLFHLNKCSVFIDFFSLIKETQNAMERDF